MVSDVISPCFPSVVTLLLLNNLVVFFQKFSLYYFKCMDVKVSNKIGLLFQMLSGWVWGLGFAPYDDKMLTSFYSMLWIVNLF